MAKTYKEFKGLNLPAIAQEVTDFWVKNDVFEKSIEQKDPNKSFVFYEGPPSANGMPGIHHVMGRTIKDIFCRYNTLKGFRVNRKAGWDTHGLPIELAVEKTLGIRKEDIGTKITVEEYNQACRREVMKYTDKWEELTRIMGYKQHDADEGRGDRRRECGVGWRGCGDVEWRDFRRKVSSGSHSHDEQHHRRGGKL